VNTPADLQFDVPHPMPQPNHAPLLASYHLLLEQAADAMRVQVRQPPSASPFEAQFTTPSSCITAGTSTSARRSRSRETRISVSAPM
jgi:hypothetical protein